VNISFIRYCFKIVKISLHYGMILQNFDAMSEKIANMGVLYLNFFYGASRESFLLPANLRRVAMFRENQCRDSGESVWKNWTQNIMVVLCYTKGGHKKVVRHKIWSSVQHHAWFPLFRCPSSVAVSPFCRTAVKFRCSVKITYRYKKIPFRYSRKRQKRP